MIQIQSSSSSKKVEKTGLDSLDTFKERVAIAFNTLPKYIKFTPSLDSLSNIKSPMRIQSLMEDISKHRNEFMKYEHDLSGLVKLRDDFPDVDLTTILAHWIHRNSHLDDQNVRLMVDSELMEYGLNLDDIVNEERRDGKWVRRFEEDVRDLKRRVDEYTKVASKFDTIEPVAGSGIHTEKITIDIETDIEYPSLEDLFDMVDCSPRFPFASFRGIFKILDPVTYGISGYKDDDIADLSYLSLPTDLVLKYSDKEITSATTLSKLSNLIMSVEDNKLHISIEMNVTIENREEYINSMIAVLNDMMSPRYTFRPMKIMENAIVAFYVIPNQALDPYIYADILMNNPAIATFFSNDESIKATKKKSVIFSHFSYEGREDLFSVKNITGDKSRDDVSMFRDVIKPNTQYVKVKLLKCKNIQEANKHRNLFLKAISVYNTEYNKLVRLYESYIDDFNPIKQVTGGIPKKKGKKEDLKDIDPELFGISNYKRMCNKKPDIIEDDDVDEYEADGTQVMKFPKEGEHGVRRNYVCNHDTHPYPGLVKNKNEANNMLYPYVPCCFAEDQTEKQTSGYRTYFEDLGEKEIVYQQILTTNKFAPFNWYAYLPKNLDTMFTMINNTSRYIRKGVAPSKSSLLDCILEATGDTKVINKDKDDRIKYVEKIRKGLVDKPEFNTLYQSNWEMMAHEMRDMLKNPEIYMEPSRFCTMLEHLYKVNIYVFKRDEEDPLGGIGHERAKFVYMGSGVYDRNVFLFEHMGSESDRAAYPMCEIICKWESKESRTSIFDNQSDLANGVKWFYRNSRSFYLCNGSGRALQVPSIIRPPPFTGKIKSQIIDSYGKTRGYIISIQDNTIAINTSPHPNYSIKTENLIEGMDFLSMENEWKFVDIFLNTYKLPIDTVYCEGGFQCTGLETHWEDMRIRIKTSVTLNMVKSKYGNVSVKDESPFLDVEPSIISVYVRNRRIATILKDLFLKGLSAYMMEKEAIIATRDLIYEYVKKRVSLNEKTSYDNITTDIYLDRNGGFYSGNKLVINDREILIRLVYTARLTAMRAAGDLRDYHTRKTSNSYYIDSFDYKKYPSTVMYTSRDAFLSMNSKMPEQFRVQNRISQPSSSMILQNPSIRDSMIIKLDLIQDTEAMRKIDENGMYVCKPNSKIVRKGNNPEVLCLGYGDDIYYYNITVL
jgi:hypothetical protein